MKFTRFLYRHMKGYRLLIALAILLAAAQVGADLLSSYPLKFIIDTVTGKLDSQEFAYINVLPPLFKEIDHQIGIGIETGAGMISFSVTLFIVLGLLDALLSFILLYLAAFIAKNLTSHLSRDLFNHLLRLSIQWHNSHEQGDLAQRVTGNMADLEKFVADGLVDTLASALTVIGIVVLMAVSNLPLTLVAVIIIPILGLIIYTYTSQIKAATKKEKKAEGQVSSITTEAMGKIMEIKAFTLESFMSELFLKNSDQRLGEGRKAGNLQAQFTPLVDTVLVIATAVIIIIGAISATTTNKAFTLGPLLAKGITLGTLVLFLTFLTKLYQPIRNLSKLTTLATGASAASERIQEVLDEKTEMLAIASDYQGPKRFQGTITYEEVYFSYPSPGTNPGPIILKGINLNIPTSKKIALVGLSGSGKTTLTNLLPRFYDIPQWWGKVKIDGVDINEYPLSVLRSNISIVMQDSILFDATIRENIKIGRSEATDAEMFKAAEQACIHETILKRPEGYDAKIINQGKNLSGGQRQRIAIARAILRDTPIIIMDEPTAALDVEAEAEVMRALDSLAEGRTVLMITHRLSTVGKVDHIIVLKDGRIAEQGHYKELKKQGGIFANLLKVQNAFDINDDPSESFILTASQPPDRSTSEAELAMELDGQIISKRQLDKALLTIGRMVQNDIQVPLDNPAAQHVSRLHAKIVWKNNRWVIQDADSKYGLHYNGQKIDEQVLKDGDRIYIAPKIALIYGQKGQQPLSPIPVSQKVPAIQSSPQHVQPQKAQVLIEAGGQLISKRELDKATLTIACKQENPNSDIQIPAQFMGQGINAQVVWENGRWVAKAEHRVRYNGQMVPQHTLANGDRVYLAPTVALTYQLIP